MIALEARGTEVPRAADPTVADRRFEAILALTRTARTLRPSMLANVDRWAAPFLWTVVLLAASAGAMWSNVEPSKALRVIVAILLVTCPLALTLAAPSALLAATGSMARRGFLLRRLRAVRGLARMQTLFVDRTGRLTDGDEANHGDPSAPRLRDGVALAVRALQADGVRVRLLSGEDPAVVGRVARILGLDTVAGATTPGARRTAVRDAQRDGAIVAVLSDGIVDTLVLAQADLSIAMAEGVLIARAHADGVLVSNRLDDLVRARAMAQKAMRIVRQNVLWAGLCNAVGVTLALAGWLTPAGAASAMVASALVVVVNSSRLAR